MDGGTEPLDFEEMRKVRERLRRPVFPTLLAERIPPRRKAIMESICRTLAAGTQTVHGSFGHSLRGMIALLYSHIHHTIDRRDQPMPEETVRLVRIP